MLHVCRRLSSLCVGYASTSSARQNVYKLLIDFAYLYHLGMKFTAHSVSILFSDSHGEILGIWSKCFGLNAHKK